jgi:RNA polymerase sigma-70 factor (ECF subfamily)
MGRGSANRYDGLDESAINLIRYKARRLVEHEGFTESDLPDIEQDLALDVLRRLSRYDPRRAGARTFVSRIVDNHVATLIEFRKAHMRDYRREAGSLDERMVDAGGNVGDPIPLVRSKTYTKAVLESARLAEKLRTLRIDLERVLAALPAEQRALCERLRTATVAEISRETGVPRGTLYERIGEIRSGFEKAGLAVYVRKPTVY